MNWLFNATTNVISVSMEHLQRVWHASRERLPFRTPGSAPPHLGLACAPIVDQIPRTCHVDFSPRIPLGTSRILLIYVTAHRYAGGLEQKANVRSASQRHRHFVGFFNVPVQALTRVQLFIRFFRHPPPPFSPLLRHARDTEDTFST